MSNSDRLEVDRLSAAWGDVPVLREVCLTLRQRELLTLMGPNGSGKTTLLRCIVGLETPTGGSVRMDGRLLDRLPPHRRRIGMLFQEAALFPDRTASENVAYGLEIARWPSRSIDERVVELLSRLEIRPLATRRADRLSGGERQRVALARTLAPRPPVVLLDEPFASVDPEFRDELRADFRRVLREEGVAAIHVTHDRAEGLFLGDRVAVLIGGTIRDCATPREVFDHPSSEAVARFLGYNVLLTAGHPVGVHPDDIGLTLPSDGQLVATVVSLGTTGPRAEVHLVTDEGSRITATPRVTPAARVGERIGVRWTREVALPIRPAAPNGGTNDLPGSSPRPLVQDG